LPEGADVPGAEARLLDALEREIAVTIAPQGPAAHTAKRRLAGRGRTLLAIAAVVVAATGLLWSQVSLKRAREEREMRGAPPAPAAGAWNAAPVATGLGSGRVRLAWAAAPGATSYTVVFLGDDLRERARVGSLQATTLELERARLPVGLASLAPGSTVLWRVSAYAGGDELGRSATSPLVLP
jgi:hypothetical protein